MLVNNPFYNLGSGEVMTDGVGDSYGLNAQGLRGLGEAKFGKDIIYGGMRGLGSLGDLSDYLPDFATSSGLLNILLIGLVGYVGVKAMFGAPAKQRRGKRALDREYGRHTKKLNRIQRRYKLGIAEMGHSKKRVGIGVAA